MENTSDIIINGEQIIGTAERSQRDVSALSIFDAENMRYVKNVIAPKLAHEFGADRDDVEQDVWLKLLKSAKTLPQIESPKSFCFVTGKNNCLNNKRRTNREIKYLESLKTQDIHSTRKTAGGGTKVLYCTKAASPEEELLKSELREKVRKILQKFPPEKRRIIQLFWSGKSPKEIAELTGTPLKTIYGILKRIEKEILKELDLQEKFNREPELDDVLMDLIISSLENQIHGERHL